MKGVFEMTEQTKIKYSTLQHSCIVLSLLSIAAGAGGMVSSFHYLASSSMEDIIAGTSGFVAGSVFGAAGLISLALLNLRQRG